MANKKIGLLIENLKLTTIDHEVSKKEIKDKRVHNLEDGIPYYSALKASCCIINTEDTSDFHFSRLPVVGCEDFILQYFLSLLSLPAAARASR